MTTWCALYLQVLEDLWATDPALNDGVAQLGLDLSQTRLSPAEQGAVGVALSWQRDCPGSDRHLEALADQGTSTESEWSGTTASSSPLRRRTLPGRSPSPPRNGEAAPAPTGSPTAPPARTHPATGTAIPWAGRRFRRKEGKRLNHEKPEPENPLKTMNHPSFPPRQKKLLPRRFFCQSAGRRAAADVSKKFFE